MKTMTATTKPATVTVRITVTDAKGERNRRASLYEFDRQIVTRPHHDAPPWLGRGVTIIEGGFKPVAGTPKYVELGPLPGTVVEVRDVPRDVADDYKLEIVRSDGTPDHDELSAERAQLAAWTAAVDAVLS